MSYAKILNGAVVAYPYTWQMFEADNNGTNYPAGTNMAVEFPLTAAASGSHTLVQPVETMQPSYTASCQYAPVELTPIFINGVLTQQWSEPVTFVPQQVSSAQMMIALSSQTYNAALQTYIATLPSSVQIAFNKTNTFEREDSLIASLAENIQLTSSQIDALFTEAAAIIV